MINQKNIILYIIALLFSAIIFIIDISIPLGISIAAMYCMVVLYSWLLPGVMISFYTAMFCTVLTLTGLIYSPDKETAASIFGLNRIISVIVIWVCATLVLIAKRGLEELELSNDTLEEQVAHRTKELKLNEEKIRLMVEEVEDYAIVLMDVEGNIEEWNKGAMRLKGYKSYEIIGKNFRIFYTADDRHAKKPQQLIDTAAKEKRVLDEGLQVRKDGSTFWCSVAITAICDEFGEIIGYSKVVRDLTKQRESENLLKKQAEKLKIKNKELEQFAFIASHDLQEPLYTISSFTQMLYEKYNSQFDETGIKSLKFMLNATSRMSKLIHGLLNYSRIGQAKDLVEIDCAHIVKEVREDLASLISEADARIEVGDLPKFKGYRTDIRQLFQNLIHNAIKFRKKDIPPCIKITSEQKNKFWKISVEDNGIGIEDEYIDRIFVIFQRLHNQKNYKGTGIGLSLCRKIVDLHGGKIWAYSKPNSGSVFYFTIPKMEKHEQKVKLYSVG